MTMSAMDKTFDITGIGVSVLDTVLVVDQLPKEEEVIRATERSFGLGGGVAVAMATAGLLGGRVAFADSLGDDPLSDTILATLSHAKVNLASIQRTVGHTASIATILVDAASGKRTIVYSPGTVGDLQWTESLAQQVATSRILHINGRHLDACHKAIEIAKANGVKVSFDGGAHRYRDEVLPLVKASDVLIVAEHFALAHWHSFKPAGKTISPAELVTFLQQEFDVELVAVTCGERGSWIGVSHDEAWHQPAALANPVRDTTGCGDTYHGAFLCALAKGNSPRRCGEIASRVAASNAEQLGAFALLDATWRNSVCHDS